jgi:hypothetical protein
MKITSPNHLVGTYLSYFSPTPLLKVYYQAGASKGISSAEVAWISTASIVSGL